MYHGWLQHESIALKRKLFINLVVALRIHLHVPTISTACTVLHMLATQCTCIVCGKTVLNNGQLPGPYIPNLKNGHVCHSNSRSSCIPAIYTYTYMYYVVGRTCTCFTYSSIEVHGLPQRVPIIKLHIAVACKHMQCMGVGVASSNSLQSQA